jgi:PST family polysaccharide transporter
MKQFRLHTLLHNPASLISAENMAVFRNFMSLSFMKGLEYLAPLFLIPYLIRTLGVERYGILQSVLSYISVFLILANYGFSFSAARQISIYRDDPQKLQTLAGSVLALRLLFMLASFILMCGIAWCTPNLNAEFGLCILTFGYVAGDTLFPIWLYQGLEKMHFLSRFQIASRIPIFILTFLLIKSQSDYLIYPAIYYGLQCLMGLLCLLLTPRLLGIHFGMPDFTVMKQELIRGWQPFRSGLAQALYTQPRLFLLSLFCTPQLTGEYAVADKAAGVLQLFPVWLFVFAALPRLSYLYEQNQDLCRERTFQFQRFTLYYSLISIPIAIVFAPYIIYAFAGHIIENSVFLFRILCLEVLIVNANIFRVHFFAASGHYQKFASVYSYTSISTLIIFMVAIPLWGTLGMAIASVLSACLLTGFTFMHLRQLQYAR